MNPIHIVPDVGTDVQPFDAALAYARADIPVFPLWGVKSEGDGFACECGRPNDASKHKPGKHPRVPGGFCDATTNPDQIRAWWARWPNANIGIPTGERSGVDVIDIDPKNGGSLESLEYYGELPDTYTVATGGGGFHLYFQHREGVGCRTNVIPGVDVRGDGGYVVAPPSLHVSGGRYHVEH